MTTASRSERLAALLAAVPYARFLGMSAELAGDPITEVLTTAPAEPRPPIGGLKVVTANGWFAARPSGTEDVYKVYAESMDGEEHLARILVQAERIVSDALAGAGASR